MKLPVACAALAVCLPAAAGSLSFSGNLPSANAAALIQLELSAPATLLVQSWGYGGTAAAPGGRNAAGSLIAPDGFDAYVSLFNGWGNSATFLASNDDGFCPPATASPGCRDPRLPTSTLAAGRYTVAVTMWNNYPFAENLGSGTLGDGFIGLAGDFEGRTSAWAVDLTSVALVPEPGAAALFVLGLVALASQPKRRLGKQGEL